MRSFLTVLILIFFLFTTGCVKSIKEVPVSEFTDADADEQIDETPDNTEDDIILTDEDEDRADESADIDDASNPLDDDFAPDDDIIITDNEPDSEPDIESDDDAVIIPSDPSPIDLEGIPARFYADIAYGPEVANLFDVFIPETSAPSPLVIFVHGGGFTGGDKSEAYNAGGPFVIRALLQNGIAFATINYRLLANDDKDGVKKPMGDCRRALQFMRYNAGMVKVDKTKIAMYGFSAGGGTSLWIGFNDDMADPLNLDPVLRESTRMSAIAALETQATYDLVRWETEILKPFDITLQSVVNLGFGSMIYSFYGVSSLNEIYTPDITAYRDSVDMLDLMTSDDPEIYVSNGYNNAGKPSDLYALLHHPNHAKALKDEAEKKGLDGVFYAPALNITDSSNEELVPFFIRKLTE